MSMGERRIYRLQAIGGSIYVALPKEWIRRFGLDKGSLVEIELDVDGSLRIRPIEHITRIPSKTSRISIEVKNPNTVLGTLISLYLAGFDVIELRFSEKISSYVRESIEEVRRILLGLEIVEETPDSIVLQIFSSNEAPIEVLIKNMGKLARTMYFDVIRGLRNGDKAILRSVEHRENDLDRLYFFTVRSIRKTLLSGSTILSPERVVRLVDLRIAARIIEEIGDYIDKAAREALKILDLNIDLSFVTRLVECMRYIDEAFHSFLTTIAQEVMLQEDVRFSYIQAALESSKCISDTKMYYEGRVDIHITKLITFYENIAAGIYDLISLIYPTFNSIH